MSASPIPFAFEDHLVRAVRDAGGEPWFVAKDVCRVLGISDHHQAIDSLDDDERGRYNVPTPSGDQEMKTVSESGLYSLVFRSRKPEARRFRKWVTAEVLPSLRKTGRYEARQGGQASLLELPHLLIRPQLRAAALHSAVQVAKMQGGNEAEVDRLFERYCGLFAAAPAQAEDAQATRLAHEWADSCLTATEDPGPGKRYGHLVTSAMTLYTHYSRWTAARGVTPLGLKIWTRLMRTLFTFRLSATKLYFARLAS